MTPEEAVKNIQDKFTSCNDIPVECATITIREFNAIMSMINTDLLFTVGPPQKSHIAWCKLTDEKGKVKNHDWVGIGDNLYQDICENDILTIIEKEK